MIQKNKDTDVVSSKRIEVARRFVVEMFKVQSGEVFAITADSGSDEEMVKAFVNAAKAVGAKPLVLAFPKARDNGQAGIEDWADKALTAALSQVDIWLEMNESFMLYSDIWETTMKNNKKLRFLTITGSSLQSLERVFCNYEISLMGKLLRQVKSMVEKSSTIRIQGVSGTDVTFNMEVGYPIDLDDGDLSMPKFGTGPGYLNLVPKLGTMNGRIVFDMIMHADLSDGGKVEFVMKNGKITEFTGNKSSILKKYIEQLDDENMYKISHMMIGLNPGVRELSWEIVEDERIWGGVDFGFGYTSPIDMPPHGQKAVSHFDGVIKNASVFLDVACIIKNGEVIHPKLKPLADRLLKQSHAS